MTRAPRSIPLCKGYTNEAGAAPSVAQVRPRDKQRHAVPAILPASRGRAPRVQFPPPSGRRRPSRRNGVVNLSDVGPRTVDRAHISTPCTRGRARATTAPDSTFALAPSRVYAFRVGMKRAIQILHSRVGNGESAVGSFLERSRPRMRICDRVRQLSQAIELLQCGAAFLRFASRGGVLEVRRIAYEACRRCHDSRQGVQIGNCALFANFRTSVRSGHRALKLAGNSAMRRARRASLSVDAMWAS